MDFRPLALWFLALLVPYVWIVALLVTILFIIANMRDENPGYLVRRIQMSSKFSTPLWRRNYAIVALLASGIGAGTMQEASAEFVIIDGQGGAWEQVETRHTTAEKGSDASRYYENPLVEGGSEGVPLSIALQQVLPAGWSVFYGDDRLKDVPVSWAGGMSLVDVLANLAQDHGLDLEADFDRERLYAAVARDGGRLRLAGKYASSLKPGEKEIWKIARGELLTGSIQRWAERASYTLVWELAEDYRVVADATFTGTFRDAIDHLARSYRQQGAMKTVEWVFKRGNKVLVVRHFDPRIAAPVAIEDAAQEKSGERE
ncbi:TcpQ domain-containing protein [Alcanivorax sp. 1008]|uniref:TcpQ domain-containing protein n=1 Tax=Alcanivorax sp. 1008 TaxID=2816853 RepID=UPI001E318245|nr:TcpQ domain-containing protein [Alcanivorax sp. 1008]